MPDDEQKTDHEKPVPGEPAEPQEPDEEAGEPEAPAQGADKFRPEAIAARVDSIGEETDAERVSREEEKKLLERRREQKKGGKKGLQTAASKRLAKIGEGTVKRPGSGLGGLAGAVTPEADPLLERAAGARRWIREHGQVFGAVVTVGVLGFAGFIGWSYWQDKRNDDASALLAKAFADERGHISDKDPDDDDEAKTKELYPTFRSAAERRDAALAKYRTVESKYSGTGAAILARLAEASLLLDAGDAKSAVAAYGDVRSSALAQADAEVRGRAIEGIGFAHELLAQVDADKDKNLDAALAAYRDLGQVDVKGLKELGLYHQARVTVAKGDKAKAIDLLKEAHKLVTEPGEGHSFSYLEFVVEDRLRELDPSALPPKAPKSAGPPGGQLGSDNPQIQELLRQLNEQKRGGGAPPVLPMPPSPAK